MNPTLLILALAAFSTDSQHPDAANVIAIGPDSVTRFAYNPADQTIEVSSEKGPMDDGKIELVDAITVASDQLAGSGFDKVTIVRLSGNDLDPMDVQAFGAAIDAYMEMNTPSTTGAREFATAAIADTASFDAGNWQTVLLTRNTDGQWTRKNMGLVSIQLSTDGTFAILADGKVARVNGSQILQTLLDNTSFRATLDSGFAIDDGKYLVRAPTNKGGAFAVVGDNCQTVYNADFEPIGIATSFNGVVIPVLFADTQPAAETGIMVTTVFRGDDGMSIQRGIPFLSSSCS